MRRSDKKRKMKQEQNDEHMLNVIAVMNVFIQKMYEEWESHEEEIKKDMSYPLTVTIPFIHVCQATESLKKIGEGAITRYVNRMADVEKNNETP